MISAIWEDSFVEEGNLAKQISRLRKVINTNGEDYIETVPKHGYRFKADLRLTMVEPTEPVVLEKRTVKRVKLAFEADAKEQRSLSAYTAKRPRHAWVIGINATAVVISGSVDVATRNKPSGYDQLVAVLPLQSISNEDGRGSAGIDG